MSESDLKKHFAILLKGYVKRSKLRQLEVARRLDISASAVSQMLSGRVMPNLKQLDEITRMLALSRFECAELRDCLARIRSGDEGLRSPLNDFIRSSRIRSGLSLEQLSEKTGIPPEHLEMLENKLNIQPSPYEAVRLAAVFECNINDLCQISPGLSMPDENRGVPEKKRRGITVLRDEGVVSSPEEKSGIKIPVINWADLGRLDNSSERLVDFAWRHLTAYKAGGSQGGIVCVKCSGSHLGWSDLYDVNVYITESSRWIPGANVIYRYNGSIASGKASTQKMFVEHRETAKFVKCDVYWLVCEMECISEIFNIVNNSSMEKPSGDDDGGNGK